MYKKYTKEERAKKNEEKATQTAELFIKAINENNAPWQKEWDPAINRRDFNMFTMKNDQFKTYNGFNELTLALSKAYLLRTDDPRWFTFKNLMDYNENLKDPKDKVYIKRGESMTPISFYSPIFYDKDGKRLDPVVTPKKELEEKTARTALVNKTYFIANACQTERYLYDENGKPVMDENGKQKTGPGFPYELTKEQIEKAKKEFEPKYKIEEIIKNTGVKIFHDTNNRSYFDPAKDEIHLPQKERFSNAQGYYQTLAHELVHWAGDKRRLARVEAEKYGESQEMRAREELVAEIGCYQLCKEAQFLYKPTDNNKAYVQSWCSIIKEKNDAIEEACKKAQKSVNYIMDFTVNKNKKTNEKEQTKDVEIVISKEEVKHKKR